MKEVAKGSALGVKYRIEALTGQVADEKSWSETEVTARTTGGGGMVAGGVGTISPSRTTVETKTTTFQDLFLIDDEGIEHKAGLKNFSVSCRPGHKLTMLKIIGGMGESWFRAYNHNTRESEEADGAVSGRMFPRILHIAGILVWAWFMWQWSSSQPEFDGFEKLASFIIGMCVGLLVMWVAAKILGIIRSICIRANTDLKAYWNSVKQ